MGIEDNLMSPLDNRSEQTEEELVEGLCKGVEIDFAVKQVVESLNRIDGVKATPAFSDSDLKAQAPYLIYFDVNKLEYLPVISRCFDNRYGGMVGTHPRGKTVPWQCILSNKDIPPYYYFWVKITLIDDLTYNKLIRLSKLITYWYDRWLYCGDSFDMGKRRLNKSTDTCACHTQDWEKDDEWKRLESMWDDLVKIKIK